MFPGEVTTCHLRLGLVTVARWPASQVTRAWGSKLWRVTETLDQNHVPSHVLELDLHIRPVGTASGHMALLGDGK